MGQDWKTLSLVVVAAAIAGWLTVRALRPAPTPQVASAPKPAATAAPVPTAVEAPAPAETAAPAAPTPTAAAPVAAAEVDESEAIVRELEALQLALVKDQRIEDRALARINDILDIPGVVEYRRAPDFWQPALGPEEEANP
jgi:hypothetical protein